MLNGNQPVKCQDFSYTTSKVSSVTFSGWSGTLKRSKHSWKKCQKSDAFRPFNVSGFLTFVVVNFEQLLFWEKFPFHDEQVLQLSYYNHKKTHKIIKNEETIASTVPPSIIKGL